MFLKSMIIDDLHIDWSQKMIDDHHDGRDDHDDRDGRDDHDDRSWSIMKIDDDLRSSFMITYVIIKPQG